jgi:hypothetical protein
MTDLRRIKAVQPIVGPTFGRIGAADLTVEAARRFRRNPLSQEKRCSTGE